MEITFSGKYAVSSETLGISFEANLDGHRINCNVSQEALQDIDPDNAVGDAEQRFLANRSENGVRDNLDARGAVLLAAPNCP